MKDYAHQIKRLRERLALTQFGLAARLGVQPQVVASWEQGRRQPSAESYFKLAKLAPPEEAWFFLGKIGITKELILSKWGGEADRRPSPQWVQPPEVRIYTTEAWKAGTEDRLRFQVQIPVLRDEAAAGSPREINENDIESFIAVPARFVPKGPGAYTGIYIRGDSMEPTLCERFIVVIDHTERALAELRGQIVAARVNDGVAVKRLAAESRAERIVLRSDNPAYPDIVLEAPERDPIIGQVVFWWGNPIVPSRGRPSAGSVENR